MAHSRQCICIPSPNHQISFPSQSERSDFWPSVSLAAVLSLIFILVVNILLSAGGVPIIPHGSHARSSNGTPVSFPILLSSQPPSTWQALRKSLQMTGEEENPTVIAVAPNNAIQTLICFSSSLMSLLSRNDQVLTKTLLHDESLKISEHLSKISFISVITQKKGQAPYGIILGPEDPLTGGGHLWKMALTFPELENERTTLNEASAIAVEILQALSNSGYSPKTYNINGATGQSVPVLEITADPYLESGFVC
ncbi:uncharacterized protein O3C94_010696 [Discoglossus pictus]